MGSKDKRLDLICKCTGDRFFDRSTEITLATILLPGRTLISAAKTKKAALELLMKPRAA